MSYSPDFIGLGVEKAGTSWIFACLYEHPEICIPVKEINFFCEQDKWRKGQEWYEDFFKTRCAQGKIKGEYSTSYFYQKSVPQKIHQLYPSTKLLVCLRNPIDRAFSNYINDIKAGTIPASTSFEAALKTQAYYIQQGHYKSQFESYFEFFNKKQLKVLLYDDLKENPLDFIQDIYQFLEVDKSFVPESLQKKINVGRIPGSTDVEKFSNRIAAFLQQTKIGENLWWKIKQSGLPELLRKANTQNSTAMQLNQKVRLLLTQTFEEDITYIEKLLDQKLNWRFETKY